MPQPTRREILKHFSRPASRPGGRLIPITYVPREAVEALVARLERELAMQTDQNTADTIPAGPTDPESQARDAVEAMRTKGTLTPEIEAALIGGARRHARFVQERIGEPVENT